MKGSRREIPGELTNVGESQSRDSPPPENLLTAIDSALERSSDIRDKLGNGFAGCG